MFFGTYERKDKWRNLKEKEGKINCIKKSKRRKGEERIREREGEEESGYESSSVCTEAWEDI